MKKTLSLPHRSSSTVPPQSRRSVRPPSPAFGYLPMPTPEISEGKVKPERGGETEMITITPSSTLTPSNNNTTFKCVSPQVVENNNNVPPCSDYELALQLHAAELETARVAREMRRLGISGGGSKKMSSLRR